MTEKVDVPPQKWYKLRNPFKLVFNLLICEIAKIMPVKLKNWMYRMIGVEIVKGTVIAPHVQIDPFFPEEISIGENALIGWGAKVLAHEFDNDSCIKGEATIGDDVLIGHGTANRPGIKVGDNATVGAQSFINRDVEENEKVGGVPVEKID